MKLKFTASSISSMHISSRITFLRLRKMPAALMANSAPERARKWNSVIMSLPLPLGGLGRHADQAHAPQRGGLDLLTGILAAGVLAATQRERDGGHDAHQQDHRGDLEGIGVVGVDEIAELAGVAVVGAVLQRRAEADAELARPDHVADLAGHDDGH